MTITKSHQHVSCNYKLQTCTTITHFPCQLRDNTKLAKTLEFVQFVAGKKCQVEGDGIELVLREAVDTIPTTRLGIVRGPRRVHNWARSRMKENGGKRANARTWFVVSAVGALGDVEDGMRSICYKC